MQNPTAGTEWNSWHLHLGSNARTVHDRVLTDVVGPAVASLGGKPWFFIRYWQAGPHLRLRVGDLDQGEFDRIEQALRDGLRTTGRLTDDEEPVDPAAYALSADRLAAGETGENRSVHDLLEPGVYRTTYPPETERYGGAELMPRTERLFQLSSELVLAMVPHAPTQARRSLMALRATMSAATTLGDAAEQSYFYAHGLAAWRSWAAESGHTAEQLDQLVRSTEQVAEGARSGAKPVDPHDHGPFRPWHTAIAALTEEVRRTTSRHPGQVVSSHVHMLHNRLGLSLLEELRSYAWLAHVFPVEESVTDRPLV